MFRRIRKSIFWSWLRPFARSAGRPTSTPAAVSRPELEDTQPLPPVPVQPSYTQDTGRYRPRRPRNDRRWECGNPGARRRVGGPLGDSRVAL